MLPSDVIPSSTLAQASGSDYGASVTPLGYIATMTDIPLPPDADGYVPPFKDAPRHQDVFPNAVPLTTEQLMSYVLPFDQQPEEIRSFAATGEGAAGVMSGIRTEFYSLARAGTLGLGTLPSGVPKRGVGGPLGMLGLGTRKGECLFRYQLGVFVLVWVASALNLSDCGTKTLDAHKFNDATGDIQGWTSI